MNTLSALGNGPFAVAKELAHNGHWIPATLIALVALLVPGFLQGRKKPPKRKGKRRSKRPPSDTES